MKITTYAAILLFLVSCTTTIQEKTITKKVSKRPNILFIMTDDHARNAISAYGSPLINTPNIDLLANHGVRFTNCAVINSICGPSRAVVLTGKYSHINGYKDNKSSFNGNQQTFPKLYNQQHKMKISFAVAMLISNTS